MNQKISLTFILLFCCFIGNLSFGNHLIQAQERIDHKEMEAYLKAAKVTSVRISPTGRSRPWIITLDDGKMKRRGFFKHVNRPRPNILPSCYKYELAAYELDKLLNFNRVPPVVQREINETKGSLQEFLENCISLSTQKRQKIEPLDIRSFEYALEDINVFEKLSYNERNDEDIYIHKETWKVFRVDFSEAFAPFSGPISESPIKKCSKKLYQNLLKLNNDQVTESLMPYLNEEEIKALLERRIHIIQTIKELIKEKGEESVLFH